MRLFARLGVVAAWLFVCSSVESALADSSNAELAEGSLTPEGVSLLPPCYVAVDADAIQGDISAQLTGTNMVYYKESDAYWANGNAAAHLNDMRCGLVRFPGGEVTSYYHWNDMIARGQVDTWDPAFDGNKGNAANFMNLDEYMAQAAAIGCEPMVGVNIESGAKYNRTQEGIDEAKALVQYCLNNNYNVKKWFIDNETYLGVASNHQQMNVSQYAGYVNQYAAAMKTVDPNIEIVVNWSQGWSSEWQTLLTTAGANIDILDNHCYWRHGNATWDLWLTESPMGIRTGQNFLSYEQMVQDFRSHLASMGLQRMKVVSFEWNIGPSPDGVNPPSQFQTALMEAEQVGLFIRGGMDMACFWPVHGFDSYRGLFDSASATTPHPNHRMFMMYGDCFGQKLLASSADQTSVRTVAARSADGQTLWLYLLRKTNDAEPLPVEVQLQNFEIGSASASVFNAPSLDSDTATVTDLPLKSLHPLQLDLSAHSFVKITVRQQPISQSTVWKKYGQ